MKTDTQFMVVKKTFDAYISPKEHIVGHNRTMNKIINRYLLKEISLPFFLILLILTFVLLMGKTLRLMDLMVNKGVQFVDVAQLIAFLMPSLLVYTIPISLLIAILIGVGRLSSDNEITVMRSSGISLYQLFVPVLFFSCCRFPGHGSHVVSPCPRRKHGDKKSSFFNRSTESKRRDSGKGLQRRLPRNSDLCRPDPPERGLPGRGDHFRPPSRTGSLPPFLPRRAYLISDPETLSLNLRLESGISSNTDMRRSSYQQMIFQTYDINLNIGSTLSDSPRKGHREMTFQELLSELSEKRPEKKNNGRIDDGTLQKNHDPFFLYYFCRHWPASGHTTAAFGESPWLCHRALHYSVYYLLQLGSDALVDMGRLSPLVGAGGTTILFLIAAIWLFIDIRHGTRK